MTEQGMTKRSYLTVFAALVLAVALAVPAIGAGGNNDVEKIAEKALNKAKKANKKAKQALEQSGEPGPRGPAGQDGQDGADGADGEDGSARAFATINPTGVGGSGTVLSARSTPGATVTRPSEGNYCVTFPGINPATSAAVASATIASDPAMVTAEVLGNTPNCADTSFQVVTKKEQSGTSGYAGPDNFVGFTILVP